MGSWCLQNLCLGLYGNLAILGRIKVFVNRRNFYHSTALQSSVSRSWGSRSRDGRIPSTVGRLVREQKKRHGNWDQRVESAMLVAKCPRNLSKFYSNVQKIILT